MENFNIVVGVIVSVFGVKGLVKIRHFVQQPQDLEGFDEIFDDEGRIYKIKVASTKGECVIASILGVTRREEAQKFINKQLKIKRSTLPATNAGEFYHADLLGSVVRLATTGQNLGIVKNILNFGASDVLEVYDRTAEKAVYYPFIKECISFVDQDKKTIMCNTLEEVVDSE